MADFKRPQDFRKGSLLRKINEDPTYLSFFLVFDTIDKEASPLFAGPAKDYLTKVLNTTYSQKHANALDNFQKVLLKINKELPWFWQTISGLDVANTYNNMADPWWGAEKPKLEIECLEENVELTAIGLMDLYKRACYDFVRWVEVIPPNLRHFRMQVWVSEVRKFQQDSDAKNLGFFDNPDNSGNSGNVKKINQDFSLTAKPFIQLQFSHCEFDIDSIAPMFADISKNPELKKPKIAIKWGAVEQINQQLGANLVTEVNDSPLTQSAQDVGGELSYTPFNPDADRKTITPRDTARGGFALPGDPSFKSVLKDNTLGKIGDAVDNAVSGITGRIDSAKNSLTLQNNSDIGNVHGGTTGLASTLIGRATDSVLSGLLLGNVHGLSGGSLLDAVQSGSINAIANQIAGLFGGGNNSSGGINENIHPQGVDSSADGNLNFRIHEPGIDSTPDGNLNNNVHE
jgi:hypothetical protein